MSFDNVIDVAGRAKSSVVVSAVVYPACECGQPWPAHRAPGGDCCNGYRPSRPVENRGVRSYWSADWRCRMLWAVEKRIQGVRERLETRKEQ